MFWIVTVGLFLLAALFVVGPLWLRASSQPADSGELRKQANIALFQERSDELEAELSAGNLDQQQFNFLLSELQLGLLADVELEDKAAFSVHVRPKKASNNRGALKSLTTLTFLMPLAFILALPVLAFGLYSHWGYIDDVQVMDLFQRTVDNQGDSNETRELIVALGELAQTNPDMPWAFYFLAENFAAVGLFEEAQIAYQRAADLLEATPEKALVLGRIAMAMYINSEFEFSSQIRAVIDEARAINPNEMSVLQLLAADAEQREGYSDAIDYWRLMIQVDPNGEFAQELRFRIAAAQEILAGRDEETAGPRISVTLSLSQEVDLAPDLRVFLAVRNAEQDGLPPLAALDTTVSALPASFQLDNTAAVGPYDLSSAESVYVTALVSFRGVATPFPGDYRAESPTLTLDADAEVGLELVLSERLR